MARLFDPSRVFLEGYMTTQNTYNRPTGATEAVKWKGIKIGRHKALTRDEQ